MTPLNITTHYSLLEGLSKPQQIIDRCKELGYTSCAITDHNSISGCVGFFKAAKSAGIKPILGVTYDIEGFDDTIIILAKNYDGWKELIRLTSLIYKKDKREISLTDLGDSNFEDLVFISNSTDHELIANLKTFNEFEDKAFLIGMDYKTLQDQTYTSNIGEEFDIPVVAIPSCYYPSEESSFDYQALLCVKMKTTYPKAAIKLEEFPELKKFFTDKSYHLKTREELAEFSDTTLKNSDMVSDMCEDYDILSEPKFPHFECPDNLTETEYIRELCEKGWKNILERRGAFKLNSEEIYKKRLEEELTIIKEANLEGYFLIVQDFVNWGRDKGWFMNPGRGSAAGSLVSYLLRINLVDPIPFGLIFSRFYNNARKGSLPDIDVDFPKLKRQECIQYVTDKYGKEKVSSLVTFGRLMGRGAIKEVLRIHEACDFKQMNNITEKIPEPAEIADKMEESDETSVLNWILDNRPEVISDYCVKEENGNLTGEYATYFEQAIRLEGTFKSEGKHAAGIIISSSDLSNECPMIRDGDGFKAAFEMKEMEGLGNVKFDLLSVNNLDKLGATNELLENGEFYG